MNTIRIAVPDLVSNSYFPALAAIVLGCFQDQGLDVRQELIFPATKAFEALRKDTVDFVAAPAHSMLSIFPDWRGVKLLAALAQGTYWLLVMRSDLDTVPGDVNAIKGRRIGAAPMVDLVLRQLLVDTGIDPDRDNVEIVPVSGSLEPGVSFGIAGARALTERSLDGFWANALGAEHALRNGSGKIVLDVRRGLGPPIAFHYTLPALVTSDELIAKDPALVEGIIRAVTRAQHMLRENVSLARLVGEQLFPEEADYIEAVIARDLAFYTPEISDEAVAGLIRFSRSRGLITGTPSRHDIVAMRFAWLWNEPA
jgi:NitT/TauT family transport system substrate-binding protein